MGQQTVAPAMVRVDDDADAARQGQRSPAQVHRLADGLLHPLRHGQGIGLASHVLQQQHELVGTDPGHRVGVAQAAAQAQRHVLEHAVAGAVAEAVVDGGKAVQVHEQQGQAGQCQAGGRPSLTRSARSTA
jgi:hypothetical protein